MRFSIRSAVPVLSLFVVAGAGGRLSISSRLEKDFGANQSLCNSYLCDDATVVSYAYDQQLKGDRVSLSTAIQLLQDLVVRDPASALRWADLGDALAQAGVIVKANACFDQAVSLGHTSAGILISAGDFYLRYGDRPRGLRYLARTLTLTAERDESVFSYFAARDVSVEEVLASGWPADRRIAQSYLRYLIRESPPAAARKVWEWMAARDLPDQRMTGEYADFLVGRKMYSDAADAWASRLGDREAGYRSKQFLYNGDFEQEPIPAAFDWTVLPVDHVEVTRDSKPHAGQFSLRIRFDGARNVDYSQVSQKAVLRPGRYRFQAYVRTENVTTDQGVFFRIVDSEAAGRLSIETEQTLGTTDWHPVMATFVASPATRLVEVRVIRRPSRKFDNQIKGDVWIDQVSLTPLG
jgi:tetratricopeptide (TPR) repeat protein